MTDLDLVAIIWNNIGFQLVLFGFFTIIQNKCAIARSPAITITIGVDVFTH